MKDKLLGAPVCIALVIVAMAGCTVNSTKSTSWGKAGVSMLDYQTDTILCATLAERAASDNAANTAGGLSGKNSQAPSGGGGGAAAAGGQSGSTSSLPQTVGGGGAYRDSAPADVVSRAATQQRTQEMQLKQARMDTLRSCLVQRGYSEFDLTPAQRAELAKLPQGSAERREYLYKLGTDPEVLKTAAKSK